MKKIKGKWSIAIISGIVVLLLVASIFIQFRAVNESTEADVEGLREDELRTQIATYKSKYEQTTEQYNETENKIAEYSTTVQENKQSSNLLDEEYQTSQELLGLTDVEGEGITVTLEDTDSATYTSENLRNLVNELKYAGAEAISINDNRIINLTDIVTLNDSFIVMYNGSVRISSPYVIKAIGDKSTLSSTLKTKNSGFVALMESTGLKITVEESNKLTINKYNKGDITTKYMEEEE